MKNLLIITPHLSTGGCPQVVANKIELLKNDYNILCVEYHCVAWSFVVQKNRIIDSIGKEKLIILGENKFDLLNIIKEFKPDIISFEEIPEFFMDDNLTKEIYSSAREYSIFESTHDSSFPVKEKRWFPDKFIFVSAFSAFRYSMFDIPYEIVEYPVDYKSQNKVEMLNKLQLDPEYKHVLNVGLFTPRKNQSYIFDMAKRLRDYKIKFHFLGNQAGNFEFYWKPLMETKPDNCVVWGERDDVEDFMNSTDLFLFPSRGDKNNKELNPIALKEALEYKVPMMMHNLDVYTGKYDIYENISFLTGDLDTDCENLCKILGLTYHKPKFVLSYEKESNKIWITYTQSEPINYKISIKDISSGAPIYWFNMNVGHPCNWFVMPIPPHILKFSDLRDFRGFSLEFYNEDNQLEITKEIIVKDIHPNIPKFEFEPFDCSYRNYLEFFSHDVYGDLNLENLDTVIDVGANVGLFSKYVLSKNAKKVIAVEANPFIRTNIEKLLTGDEDKSKIYMQPLSGKKESVRFNYSTDNSTIGSTVFNSETPGYEGLQSTIELETITIDEILNENNLERISLFKCDIEGGEYDLIESLTDFQMKKIDRFLIEFHKNHNGELDKIVSKLKKYGFICEFIKVHENCKVETIDSTHPHGVLITKLLNDDSINNTEAIIITTYPNTSTRKQLTKDCILSFKSANRPIILVSHYPVSEELQNLVDYYIYDKNNELTHHSYYNRFFYSDDNHSVNININGLKSGNQSLAAMINLFNGVKLAKELGFKKVLTVVYDVILHEKDLSTIDNIFEKMDEWNCYLSLIDTAIGKGVETTSMGFNIDYFLNKFLDYRNKESFNKACERLGTHNFLEVYFWEILKSEHGLWIEHNKENSILPNSGLGSFSNSEYFSIVPIKDEPNNLVVYFKSYNVDNRDVNIIVESDDSTNFNTTIKLSETNHYFNKLELLNSPVKVTINYIDNGNTYKSDSYVITKDNINTFNNNGEFTYKLKKNYKIKLVHLQTTVNDSREIQSRESLEPLKKLGIDYVLYQNNLYKELPPINNCLRPQCVNITLFDEEKRKQFGTALTPAHYGCYDSFKKGILNEFTDDIDFLIVCEGDCILEVTPEKFVQVMNQVCDIVNQEKIEYFSFGDTSTLDFGWKQSNRVSEIPNQDLLFITDKIIGLQCIMFPRFVKDFLTYQLNNHKWDAADIYFNTIFVDNHKKMGILNERITSQADGLSFLDQENKIFRK